MKKKTLISLLSLSLFFLLALSVSAFSTDRPQASDWTAVVDGQTIIASDVDGETYLFLPSSADLSAVRLSCDLPDGATVYLKDTTETIGESTVDITKAASYDTGKNCYDLLYTVAFDESTSSQSTIHIMQSANTAAVYLNVADDAYGREWIDGSPDHTNDAAAYTDVTMTMIESDSTVVYDGALTSLKGRGNTTWQQPKKPYQIKLDKKTDLLSSGNKDNKNKTWVLLTNALDKTLFKNALAFDLSHFLGLTETPEYRFVELYFDGEYRGSYLLCEKVQINSGRVDIENLEDHNTVTDETATAQDTNKYGFTYQYNPTATCDTEDISGGYLLERDSAFYASENSWFRAGNMVIVIKSPECATKEQAKFISEAFYEMLTAAQNDEFNGKLVTEYLDIDSMASLYLVNEYLLNCDFGASSTYFFLPEQGNEIYEHKFYAGPAWDFDTSLGNRTELDWMQDPTYLFAESQPYFTGSVIRDAIREKKLLLNDIEDILFSEKPLHDDATQLSSLLLYKSRLDASQKMNFTVWPFDNTPNTFCYPTYDENYDYVYQFLKTRHESLVDSAKECTHICHKTGKLATFLYKILRFFWKLFGIHQYCECGMAHY